MQSSISRNIAFATTTDTSFMDVLRQSLYGRIFLAVAATAFVAACAHVSVPLPYTPVPVVLSDFAVLIVGMVLGPVAGFVAMALYLAEGAIGMPVFSPHGPGGVFQLMGPTGGYLLSYPVAAAAAGLAGPLVRKGLAAFSSAVVTGTAAVAIILACGAAWLGHLGFGNSSATWSLAVTPFLFGSLAKIVGAAAVFASTYRRLASHSRNAK